MKSFFRNKFILVTGGTGLIGIQLVKKLVSLGAKVSVASLENNPDLPKNVTLNKIDLRILKNCLKVTRGIDYVFHLAGIKGSPKMAKENPYTFMVPMLLFNTNMIEASRINKVKRFLYTSSIGVYNPRGIMKEDDVWETFPSRHDWYSGWSKRIGELTVEAYAKENSSMKISIVRPANVFGPFDNFNKKSAMVIPSLINKFFNAKNKKIEVWGNGMQIRDFIYSEIVADAMMFIMTKNFSYPVNIASGRGYKIKELVEIINSYFNNKYKITWKKSKFTGDKVRIMSVKRLKNLGFDLKFNLKESVFKTIKWYAENKNKSFKRYSVF
jgi:GDP-L-fucose synthase